MTLCFVIFLEVYRSPLFSYIYIPSEGVPISLYLPKAKSSRVCAYAEKMLVPLTPCVCVCVARQERIPRRISRVKKKSRKGGWVEKESGGTLVIRKP